MATTAATAATAAAAAASNLLSISQSNITTTTTEILLMQLLKSQEKERGRGRGGWVGGKWYNGVSKWIEKAKWRPPFDFVAIVRPTHLASNCVPFSSSCFFVLIELCEKPLEAARVRWRPLEAAGGRWRPPVAARGHRCVSPVAFSVQLSRLIGHLTGWTQRETPQLASILPTLFPPPPHHPTYPPPGSQSADF